MRYYRAWYRSGREGVPADERFPDWVVAADDEADARAKVLAGIGRAAPERGFEIYLRPIENEEAGIIAFASARQSGQAIS